MHRTLRALAWTIALLAIAIAFTAFAYRTSAGLALMALFPERWSQALAGATGNTGAEDWANLEFAIVFALGVVLGLAVLGVARWLASSRRAARR